MNNEGGRKLAYIDRMLNQGLKPLPLSLRSMGGVIHFKYMALPYFASNPRPCLYVSPPFAHFRYPALLESAAVFVW